ncbi:uncharacterized protein CC84DRAFT_1244097 [Paraphaeosphaeria sporulosa]|uniref:Uncharacterized protein n=1 Tax=Paraphaeosphaeria sporulosa TaxID=1460663 RepID=A0A177CFR4_9PLEO|nr:uncharacterized protein CC84DRAFT_1244097 [Paraphaeosphaeria sporulosa]OAG05669.1 hypothetical protein CC84DRAFT_1244097 [Paraphaeosphaeria sporulosa]
MSSRLEPEYFEEALAYVDHQGPRAQRKKEIISPTSTSSVEAKSNVRPFARSETHGSVVDGEFFRVAQLWCLIFGDRNQGKKSQVTDGGIRLWLMPTEKLIMLEPHLGIPYCQRTPADQIRDKSLDEGALFLSSDKEADQQSPESDSNGLLSARSQAQRTLHQASATEIADNEAFILQYDGLGATSEVHMDECHVFTLLATIFVVAQRPTITLPTRQFAAGEQYKVNE